MTTTDDQRLSFQPRQTDWRILTCSVHWGAALPCALQLSPLELLALSPTAQHSTAQLSSTQLNSTQLSSAQHSLPCSLISTRSSASLPTPAPRRFFLHRHSVHILHPPLPCSELAFDPFCFSRLDRTACLFKPLLILTVILCTLSGHFDVCCSPFHPYVLVN